MKIGWGLPKYLVFAVLISALVFPWFQGVNAIGDINAQENSTDITNTLNISTTTSATNEAVTNVSAVPANTSTSILTNTSINVTTTNTSTMTTAATGVENVTTNITTITVVSYITLPPVTRPPSNVEIARWLSGGVIAGILVGLSIGYAFFAKGVSIKRQQVGGKGVKAGERMEKRRK
ncbi:MAG: hypothetical protein ACO2O0_12175 [Desulfurococcales archaeon]|jgi:hypothetical protein